MKKIISVLNYLGYAKFETSAELDEKYPTHSHCKLSSIPKEFPVYVQHNGIVGEWGDNYVYHNLNYLYESDIKEMQKLSENLK